MSGRHVDPELPWGNWLRMELNDRAEPVFVDDETGGRWSSLRSALWAGRLGMDEYKPGGPPEILETMHAVLAATVRRRPDCFEQAADFFDGSKTYARMFHLWLASKDLVVLADHRLGAEKLTPEGWSVLHMLMATRPYDVRRRRPSAATIGALVELGLGPEEREERLARVEKETAGWDASFRRRPEAGKSSIILSKRGDGLVPVFQTVWTLRLKSPEQRDSFYDWMCHRLDRWEEWGKMATEYGGETLTHHLLQVAAAALADSAGGDASADLPGSG